MRTLPLLLLGACYQAQTGSCPRVLVLDEDLPDVLHLLEGSCARGNGPSTLAFARVVEMPDGLCGRTESEVFARVEGLNRHDFPLAVDDPAWVLPGHDPLELGEPILVWGERKDVLGNVAVHPNWMLRYYAGAPSTGTTCME